MNKNIPYDALKDIKNYCSEHEFCNDCELFDSNCGNCFLKYSLAPQFWDVMSLQSYTKEDIELAKSLANFDHGATHIIKHKEDDKPIWLWNNKFGGELPQDSFRGITKNTKIPVEEIIKNEENSETY